MDPEVIVKHYLFWDEEKSSLCVEHSLCLIWRVLGFTLSSLKRAETDDIWIYDVFLLRVFTFRDPAVDLYEAK